MALQISPSEERQGLEKKGHTSKFGIKDINTFTTGVRSGGGWYDGGKEERAKVGTVPSLSSICLLLGVQNC